MGIDSSIGMALSLGVALLFASAAWHKWRSGGEFAATLDAYQVLPAALISLAARVLPAMELLTAIALLVPRSRTAAMLAAAALLCAYAAGIGLNLRRGHRDLDCGCMVGGKSGRIAAWMVWRNLLIAALLLLALPPWSTRQLGIVDVLTIAATTGVAALLYQSANLLLGLAPGTARRGASS